MAEGKLIAMVMAFAALAAACASDVRLEDLDENWFCETKHGYSMRGKWRVRDLWRQRDDGVFENCYEVEIPGHATQLVRIWPVDGGCFDRDVQDIRDFAWMNEIEEDRPLKPTDSECGGCESRRAMAEQNGPATGKVEVVCVYYPHWHRYRKGDEWFGADNWKEGKWSFVKTARPRFGDVFVKLVDALQSN